MKNLKGKKRAKTIAESNPFEHQIGDIILTNSEDFIAKCNIGVQKKFYGTEEDSSSAHALICFGHCAFVEATYRKSLKAYFYKDNVNSNNVKYQVIRNKEFKNDKNKQEKLRTIISYHLGKKYTNVGKIFLKKEGENNEMFCSQFVVEIFKKIGIDLIEELNLTTIKPSEVMPGHLEKLVENINWEKIDYYLPDTENINTMKNIEELEKMPLVDIVNSIDKNNELLTSLEKKTFKLMESTSKTLKKLDPKHKENSCFLTEKDLLDFRNNSSWRNEDLNKEIIEKEKNKIKRK